MREEKRFIVKKTFYPNEGNKDPKKIRYFIGHNKAYWNSYNDLMVWKWGYKSKADAEEIMNEEVELRKWECERNHKWSIKLEIEEYTLDPKRNYEQEYKDFKADWHKKDMIATYGEAYLNLIGEN